MSWPVHTRSSSSGCSPKRRAILEAAAKLFLSRGFERTSMDSVAEASGAGRRTAYRQFKNKKALFDATFALAWESLPLDRITSAAGTQSDPNAALHSIACAIAGFWSDFAPVAFENALLSQLRPTLEHHLAVSLALDGLRFKNAPQWCANWRGRQGSAIADSSMCFDLR